MQKNIKYFIILNMLLLVYSMSGILSKKAAGAVFLSLEFCLYYAGIIALLGLYAIGWQQIIKHLPLTTAFANKAITIVWGILWSVLFFSERITIGKICGVLLVVSGVVLFAIADGRIKKNG